MRILILAALAVVLSSPEASARCIMSYCKDGATSTPTRSYITNTHRQKVGDLYDPGHRRPAPAWPRCSVGAAGAFSMPLRESYSVISTLAG